MLLKGPVMSVYDQSCLRSYLARVDAGRLRDPAADWGYSQVYSNEHEPGILVRSMKSLSSISIKNCPLPSKAAWTTLKLNGCHTQ